MFGGLISGGIYIHGGYLSDSISSSQQLPLQIVNRCAAGHGSQLLKAALYQLSAQNKRQLTYAVKV